jgi:Mn2+/Fe2+ NRAMP family transporter
MIFLPKSFSAYPKTLEKMGEFVNGRGMQALAWFTAVLIAGLNGWFLILMLQ